MPDRGLQISRRTVKAECCTKFVPPITRTRRISRRNPTPTQFISIPALKVQHRVLESNRDPEQVVIQQCRACVAAAPVHADGLVAAIGISPRGPNWLSHRERTREDRAEARRGFWKVAQDRDSDSSLRTRAWTNLGNLFSSSYREDVNAWVACTLRSADSKAIADAFASDTTSEHQLRRCFFSPGPGRPTNAGSESS